MNTVLALAQDGINLDISKILLEITNEKRRMKKEIRNVNTNYHSLTDSLIEFKCNDCNNFNIKEIDGYYVCLKCGIKLECVIDAGQEWRNYNNDDNRCGDNARCDMPTNELLPKSSMGSLVGFSSRETFTTKRIRNMSNWYSASYKESSLMETFNNITIIALNSGLNQCVIDEAKYMFKKVSDIKSSRRTKKEGMKAGAIALACKLKGVPRNCDEIAKICHMKNSKTLRKSIKTFEEIWDNITMKDKSNNSNVHIIENDTNTDEDTINEAESLNEDASGSCDGDGDGDGDVDVDGDASDDSDEDANFNISNYTGKLHRFISALSLDEKIFSSCSIVLQYVERNNYLDKHNPLSRITSIIFYIVDRFNIKINKYQIIKTCGVSEVTINKCYQKLMLYKSDLNKIILDK